MFFKFKLRCFSGRVCKQLAAETVPLLKSPHLTDNSTVFQAPRSCWRLGGERESISDNAFDANVCFGALMSKMCV